MKFDLSRSMREAAQLTRAQRLPEAVRVIQDAMGLSRPTATGRDVVASSAKPEGAPARLGQARPLAETIKALRLGRLQGMAASLRRSTARSTAKTPPVADGARFLARSFAAREGERAYKLYLPRRGHVGRPLIVMLHGCTQTPDDFAVGTRMNALAEEIGFVVAYPAQSKTANQSLCWNWFQRRDNKRGGGEAAIIAGITQAIVAEYALDPARVFIAGMSAGGAMAATLAAEYPEIYAAVGIHSGLAAGAASDLVSAFAAMRGDHTALSTRRGPRRTRTIAFHGSADQTVHPSNAGQVGTVVLREGDVSETTTATRGGRPVTRTIARDRQGTAWLEQWLVDAAGHAWSGGDPDGSFADGTGPDASREMVRYFLGA